MRLSFGSARASDNAHNLRLRTILAWDFFLNTRAQTRTLLLKIYRALERRKASEAIQAGGIRELVGIIVFRKRGEIKKEKAACIVPV